MGSSSWPPHDQQESDVIKTTKNICSSQLSTWAREKNWEILELDWSALWRGCLLGQSFCNYPNQTTVKLAQPLQLQNRPIYFPKHGQFFRNSVQSLWDWIIRTKTRMMTLKLNVIWVLNVINWRPYLGWWNLWKGLKTTCWIVLNFLSICIASYNINGNIKPV